MITGNTTASKAAHLRHAPEGGTDYSDRRLDRSELTRKNIFKIALNPRVRRCDVARRTFFFWPPVDGRIRRVTFGDPRNCTRGPGHFRRGDGALCWVALVS